MVHAAYNAVDSRDLAPPPARTAWARLARRALASWRLAAVAGVSSLVAAGAVAGWTSLTGPLLAALLRGSGMRWGPLDFSADDLAVRVPALIVVLAAVRAGANWVQASATARLTQRVMGELRCDLQDKLVRLPLAWHRRRHSGDLLARFTGDVSLVEFAFSQFASAAARDALQVLALLGLCLATDARLFLVVFVALPGAALPVSVFARWARRAARATQASMGALAAIAAERLHHLPIVQAYRAEEASARAFDEEQARTIAAQKRSLFIRGAFTPTTELLGYAALAVCLVLGMRAVAAEPGLAARLMTFFGAAVMLYQPMKSLSQTWSEVNRSGAALARLDEILDAEVPASPARRCPPLARSLAFERVTLVYEDGRRALDDVSFEVPAGATVALVGASGSGKSSVLSLVLGFAAPTSGRVLWDGVPLDEFDLASRRARLAWVPQEPVLLSGTVRRNVALGAQAATDAELWGALDAAWAAPFVRALPAGLDAPVGERGLRLSGGQRQRLAIARALARPDAVLLLDEPTSALDLDSQDRVQQGLRELAGGRTALVAAHRLSTVREADVILVLSEGRLAESGTHAALLAAGGLYARMAGVAAG